MRRCIRGGPRSAKPSGDEDHLVSDSQSTLSPARSMQELCYAQLYRVRSKLKKKRFLAEYN